MVKDRQICTCCGKERFLYDFYASSSPFHSQTGKLHVCKQCVWDFVNEKSDNIDVVKNALRMLDKPYLIDLWKSSIQEAEKANKDIFKIYIKNLGMKQYRELTWADSDNVKDSKSNTSSIQVIEEKNLSNDELNYLSSFWGRGYELDDLIWLQSEYEDWTNRYECDSKGMETLIQEICKQQLDINTRRSNGEKVDQQLKTLQDLLGSSNLKPVQETGANAVEQESFGTLLKKYENERPVPEPDAKWKDVDKISKYIKVFFLGHLARMLGIKNDYADEYWEEINDLTVEEPAHEEDEDVDHGIL